MDRIHDLISLIEKGQLDAGDLDKMLDYPYPESSLEEYDIKRDGEMVDLLNEEDPITGVLLKDIVEND